MDKSDLPRSTRTDSRRIAATVADQELPDSESSSAIGNSWSDLGIKTPGSRADAGSAPRIDWERMAQLAGDPTKTGARIGMRYRLVAPLGRGGMGEVLHVLDTQIGRDVAIKRLLHGSSMIVRSRFLREGQICSRLDHPNILPVHDITADEDGQPFLTMPIVRGDTLSAKLERLLDNTCNSGTGSESERLRALDAGRRNAVDVLIRVCDAICYAHSEEIVHRDLKPANVMIGRFGEVHLMDWGIAGRRVADRTSSDADQPTGKAEDGDAAMVADDAPTRLMPGSVDATHVTAHPFDDDASLTLPGGVLGTPAYMAPEQALGATGDPRVDVYGLGGILYQILTFSAPNGDPDRKGGRGVTPAAERLAKLAMSRGVNLGTLPIGLVAIATKALSFNVSDRYASVEALRDDLIAWRDHRRPAALTSERLRDRLPRLVKKSPIAATTLLFTLLIITKTMLIGAYMLGEANAASSAASGISESDEEPATGETATRIEE